jgi:hypothetical protein
VLGLETETSPGLYGHRSTFHVYHGIPSRYVNFSLNSMSFVHPAKPTNLQPSSQSS